MTASACCQQLSHATAEKLSFVLCAAPLMMTAFQFAIQNLLCRIVLRLGIVQRSANAVELNWHQYFRQGEQPVLLCFSLYSMLLMQHQHSTLLPSKLSH